MLQPNPEHPPEFPPAFKTLPLAHIAQENYSYDPYYETRPDLSALDLLPTLELPPEKTKLRPRTYIARAVASLAIFTSLGYAADVGKNIDEERHAEPSISVLLEPQDPSHADHAILVENGFNSKDADDLSLSIGPAVQQITDGEVWSIQSNNAIANSEIVFDRVIEMAKQRGIKSFSIATYSMGDMRGLEVAEKIATRSDIPLEFITIISGPSGYDGLRDTQKNEMWQAKTISQLIPGSSYSTFFRYLVELYFFRDRFTQDEPNPFEYIIKNAERFGEIIKTMDNRYATGDYTSNSHLLRQISAIDTTDLEGIIKRIGDAAAESETQAPLVYYVGTTGNDQVVNDRVSAEQFKAWTENAKIAFMSGEAKDVIHSQYHRPEAIEAYNALYSSAGPQARSIIEQNRQDFYEQRYAPYLLDIAKPR